MAHNLGIKDNNRATGRLAVSNVRSSSGAVIDASATGLRIKGKAPSGSAPGSHLTISIQNEVGDITVDCEIRWIQRHPFRGATFGVSFLDIDDESQRVLFSIIRSASMETRCRWDAA